MTLLSQRDSRWKNIKLGTSDTTIGDYGCTITSIAMILGTTPDLVNERIKAVDGFSQGNLVIWTKLEEAFPGIKIKRVWSYDNADVLSNVPNVLVEVDGKPIGGYRHWVVFIGNKRLNDPWTGTEHSTSDFPSPLSYCVIGGKWNKPSPITDLSQTTIDDLRAERDNNHNLLITEREKNNELTKQLQDEQKKNQDLREINDKLTKTDADLGVELLDAQHYKNDFETVATALSATPDLKSVLEALEALKTPIDEQVKPLQQHAFNLQDALDDFILKKKYKSVFERIKKWFIK